VQRALFPWLIAMSLLAGCEGQFLTNTRDPIYLGDAAPRLDASAPEPRVDAATPPVVDAAVCDPGDERTAAVFYGTREDTTLDLTPGQVLSIVRLDLGGLCSGAVIAPRWVLSAAHCATGSGGRIALGADPDRLDRMIAVTRQRTHPSLDLMLLELAEDATVAVPGLVPIPIFGGDLAPLVGRTAEAAGYGQTETGSSGDRRFTAQPVVRVAGDFISIDGMGRRGVCFGDSGGPLMIREGGAVHVLGALSNGDPSCVGVDNYTRIDRGRAWVESFTGPSMPPPDPCMGETRAGRCDGTTAIWCESGRVLRRSCGLCGQSCGVVAGLGGVYCVD
jgi:hypothetical protein